MRLVLSAGKWGNIYRFRHFIDGKPVSLATFNKVWAEKGCNTQNGKPLENMPYGYRKVWDIKP